MDQTTESPGAGANHLPNLEECSDSDGNDDYCDDYYAEYLDGAYEEYQSSEPAHHNLALYQPGTQPKPSHPINLPPYESFEQSYLCLPLSRVDKSHLEAGNRIIMPLSAFDRLMATDNIDYPLLFRIQNPVSGRVSHCGVLEFTAEEGFVYLPDWMMKNLNLVDEELVIMRYTSLPRGEHTKIQPHAMKFTCLSNVKAVLEKTLRDFACITAGDTVMITHNHERYDIDILETRPSNAISIVDTDCQVDFAPPLDYEEPEKTRKTVITQRNEPNPNAQVVSHKFKPFTSSRCFDGTSSASVVKDKENDPNHLKPTSHESPKTSLVSSGDVKEQSSKTEDKRFQPFTGRKYTLMN